MSIHMIKFITVILGLLLLTACQSVPSIKIEQINCTEPRPEMCTMDYQPVCGFDRDQKYKTYSNACTACSDKQVVYTIKGEC